MNKNVLITGGAGFIGSNLVRRLNQQGNSDVTVVDHLEDGRKSTTGYAVYIFGCLVSWKSRLQPIIATSTHQAELIALCTGADETLWIRKLLRDLGFAINSHFWKMEHHNRLPLQHPTPNQIFRRSTKWRCFQSKLRSLVVRTR